MVAIENPSAMDLVLPIGSPFLSLACVVPASFALIGLTVIELTASVLACCTLFELDSPWCDRDCCSFQENSRANTELRHPCTGLSFPCQGEVDGNLHDENQEHIRSMCLLGLHRGVMALAKCTSAHPQLAKGVFRMRGREAPCCARPVSRTIVKGALPLDM